MFLKKVWLNFIRWKVSISILALACVAFAKEDDDQLLFALPDGWMEVYSDRTENLSTTEYIPVAQSADSWKEMISVQILLNSPDSQPDIMLTRVAAHFKNECTDIEVKPIELAGIEQRYPTLAMIVNCEKKKNSSFGEISIVRGILGKNNFYLLQKTWRTKAFKKDDIPPIDIEERKFWLGYISYLKICNPSNNDCPKL